MINIAKSDVKGLIAESVDRIYAKRTQTKVQMQIEEILVNTLQIGSKTASHEIKKTSADSKRQIDRVF